MVILNMNRLCKCLKENIELIMSLDNGYPLGWEFKYNTKVLTRSL